MADIFTKKKRSEIMSKIRSADTSLEREVFNYLRKNNVYFQKHYRNAIGCPDIALPRRKVAVFIDSDFWHGWRYERWGKNKLNEYWKNKIERNIARDKKNTKNLRRNGWKVIRIWEHQIKTDKIVIFNKIVKFLDKK